MGIRKLTHMFVSLFVLGIAGCGGGGGGGGSATAPPPPSGVAISGVASKGPIRNGHIQIFEIVSSSSNARLRGAPFYDGRTDANGNYSANLPAPMTNGGIMIQVLDGDYTDEATGLTKHIETEYGATGMRAIFGNVSSAVKNGSVSMNVTAYTELAVKDMGGHLDDSAAKLSKDKIEHAFGFDTKGVDIVRTSPVDASQVFPAGSTAEQQAYGLSLASLSQFEKDFGGGKNMSQVCDDLLANHISQDGVIDDSTKTEMSTATQTFITDEGGKVNPGLSGSTGSTSTGGTTTGGTTTGGTTTGGTTTGGTATGGTATGGTTTGGTTTGGTTPPPPPPATQAIVKLGISGTLPAGTLIGGIGATISYGTGLSITPANIVLSGVSTGSNLAANTNTLGKVALALINVNGIAAGEFVTLTFDIAAGNIPTAASFSVDPGSKILDVGTVSIPGLSASILSVTLQ